MVETGLPKQAQLHLDRVRSHFDDTPALTPAAAAYRRILTRYYNLLIKNDSSVLEIGCGSGDLLAGINAREKWGIDLSPAQINRAQEKVPEARFFIQAGEELRLPDRTFDYVILYDAVNLAADVQHTGRRRGQESSEELERTDVLDVAGAEPRLLRSELVVRDRVGVHHDEARIVANRSCAVRAHHQGSG